MPWKETSVMDVRIKFIGRLLGGEKLAARQRREVSHDIDNDGLPLVILSSGVQEGRPFFFSVYIRPWGGGRLVCRSYFSEGGNAQEITPMA